jgi:lysophospholipase L1-like esterase
VLVVGDSLEELTSPHLAKFLPGIPLTVNAVGGYNSFQILELFEESYDPSQRVIVFDAGTNDNPSYPQILAENLGKVAAAVGDRCMVVPTIHGLHPGGVDDSGKNRVVAEFAASRPGTQTPDWQGAVFSHPELMQADNLHPVEAGAELRARLIAQGVTACLAGSSGASPSSVPSRPVLAEAPKHLPRVAAIEARRDEILAAAANALIFATLERISSRAPLVAPATLAWMEAASD